MATTTTTNMYGVPLSPSVKKGVESKFKRRYGLAYPLVQRKSIVPTSTLQVNRVGQVTYFGKAYGRELIKNNLKQLIKTEKGERVMLPDYGLNLNKYLFEPLDEVTFGLIRQDILKNMEVYFSIAKVIKLAVFATEDETDKNELTIKLTIQILDGSLDVFDVEAKVG
tara:strand:- start:1046 stop:1546 length:501 start_codon:yes stop_codon:yes gene_type:complete